MPTLNAGGREIHYVETGGGERALVLVHGAGGSRGTWIRQLEGLADVARVIALDLPGHGDSPGDGCRVIADYAAAVRDFIDALGGGPVVLGGHSMGGAITQSVALSDPQRLLGIALVGTGARLRVFPELLQLLAADYPEAVAFLTRYAWGPACPDALKESGRRATLETPAPVTRGDFLACDGFDLMGRVAGIRIPALVIGGDEDRLTPTKYAEFLARAIPRARLVRIPGAGHYVPLEQPDEVNRALREFLLTTTTSTS